LPKAYLKKSSKTHFSFFAAKQKKSIAENIMKNIYKTAFLKILFYKMWEAKNGIHQ